MSYSELSSYTDLIGIFSHVREFNHLSELEYLFYCVAVNSRDKGHLTIKIKIEGILQRNLDYLHRHGLIKFSEDGKQPFAKITPEGIDLINKFMLKEKRTQMTVDDLIADLKSFRGIINGKERNQEESFFVDYVLGMLMAKMEKFEILRQPPIGFSQRRVWNMIRKINNIGRYLMEHEMIEGYHEIRALPSDDLGCPHYYILIAEHEDSHGMMCRVYFGIEKNIQIFDYEGTKIGTLHDVLTGKKELP